MTAKWKKRVLECIANNGGYFKKDIVDHDDDNDNDDEQTFFLPLKLISLRLRGVDRCYLFWLDASQQWEELQCSGCTLSIGDWMEFHILFFLPLGSALQIKLSVIFGQPLYLRTICDLFVIYLVTHLWFIYDSSQIGKFEGKNWLCALIFLILSVAHLW